jgi:TetR/AcrR family transcriptional regulator, regulator of autoinduction and epiphytic fitness
MAAQTYHQRIREEKRVGCVRAARALFLAQGYERTSLAEVAKAAALSTATLFKRYPTKASLFAAVVEDFWQAPASLPAADVADTGAALAAIGRAYAAGLADADVAGIHRLIIAEAGVFPDLGRLLAERADAPVIARIEAVLDRTGQKAGDDRKAAARAFLAIIAREVLWPALVAPALPADPAAADAAVRRATAMLLPEILPPAAEHASRKQKSVGGRPALSPGEALANQPEVFKPGASKPEICKTEMPVRRKKGPAREETLSLFAFD